MSSQGDQRLQRLLGGDELAELRLRLRRHYERADPENPKAMLRLSDLSPREYELLASFVGRPMRQASSMQIDIRAFDAALARAGIAPTLRSALEAIDGPIVHVASARAETAARWCRVIASARHRDLRRFLDTPNGLGLLKRLARRDTDVATRIRELADLVLVRLPVEGQPRAQLAAEILGDAHALDSGQPAATLILATLRIAGAVDAEPSDGEPLEEERDRSVWARAGVMVNELARPALYLNLPWRNGPFSNLALGEPAYASLRFLLRCSSRPVVADRTVFVCENANFVAIAADRLGKRCAPLVCTDGMPAAAQRTLLTLLARSGAQFRYHGDFDWAGLRIANFVIRTFNACPWRFSAADYAAIAESAPGLALSGTAVAASWDSQLKTVMEARGLAFAEEAFADALLEDLTA